MLHWREINPGALHSDAESGETNFAQRLLLANENAVTNIADLWVAAAMDVDNEEPFESDSETESVTVYPDLADPPVNDDVPSLLARTGRLLRRAPSNSPHQRLHKRSSNSFSFCVGRSSRRPSTSPTPSTPALRHYSPSPIAEQDHNHPERFGVCTPPAILDARPFASRSEDPAGGELLAPIIEAPVTHDSELQSEKSLSLTSQLPLHIIIQYGLLALHTTTHDQVFMSYLLS